MYTISMEQIENLITSVENSQPDLTPDYRIGDWVVLGGDRGESWREAHIARITEDGKMILDFGSKELSQMFRLRGMGMPVSTQEVVEHWRQIDTVTRQSGVVELGYTWVQL